MKVKKKIHKLNRVGGSWTECGMHVDQQTIESTVHRMVLRKKPLKRTEKWRKVTCNLCNRTKPRSKSTLLKFWDRFHL